MSETAYQRIINNLTEALTAALRRAEAAEERVAELDAENERLMYGV